MSLVSGRFVLAGLATAVVVIAVVRGLVMLGPPSEARARQLDQRRVQDLRMITSLADVYWARHGALPSTLEELSSEPGMRPTSRDPVSGEPYAYRALDAKKYELCAEFEHDSTELPQGFDVAFWSHGVGRRCFPFSVRENGK